MLGICRICGSTAQKVFKARILGKYDVAYYHCDVCGFLRTEDPYWLEESYREAINLSDTGALLRSLALAEITSVIIYFLFDKNTRYLDFGGGYGLFTRRMRDIGFDFFWQDRHTTNLVAKGFEYTPDMGKVELITSFETFEHFVDPLQEIEMMLSMSKNILFTTGLLPTPLPPGGDWHYYGLEHGQHISFYSLRTLQYIADKYSLNLYSVHPIHILTPKHISLVTLKLLLGLRRFGLFLYIKRIMKSRTVGDSITLAQSGSKGSPN
jgi:hypothetical protein